MIHQCPFLSWVCGFFCPGRSIRDLVWRSMERGLSGIHWTHSFLMKAPNMTRPPFWRFCQKQLKMCLNGISGVLLRSFCLSWILQTANPLFRMNALSCFNQEQLHFSFEVMRICAEEGRPRPTTFILNVPCLLALWLVYSPTIDIECFS